MPIMRIIQSVLKWSGFAKSTMQNAIGGSPAGPSYRHQREDETMSDETGATWKPALTHAVAESCIVNWIREDLPLAAQMALRPEHVRKLVLRVCGPLPAPPQDKT